MKMIKVERCGECPKSIYRWIIKNGLWCKLIHHHVDPTTLHPDCPLEDVPEPAWTVIKRKMLKAQGECVVRLEREPLKGD